jgi:arylsulfatase
MEWTMKKAIAFSCLILWMVVAGVFAQDAKPNIVLVFMDNFGWGEPGFNGGGIVRGAATPRLDTLASQGLRLTNFNVETQCTPSRSALMTGRYAIRSGNGSVPLGEGVYGLVQWEVTMAEMLSEAGYATGMFGKWHLGRTEGRFPTDQGFDEWYGIPNTTDESVHSSLPGFAESGLSLPYVLDSKKGEIPQKVRPYNLDYRPLIDRDLTDQAIAFMKRQAASEKPFFIYLPYTATHFPTLPHPVFEGKSGKGLWGDMLTTAPKLSKPAAPRSQSRQRYTARQDLGGELYLPGLKARSASPSSSVGPAGSRPQHPATRLSTPWTSIRLWPRSPAARCRGIG